MNTIYIIAVGIFLLLVLLFVYIMSEPILCHYYDLPIDNYTVYGREKNFDSRWDERVKQAWTFTYIPPTHNILEIGFGNTTSSINLNKRLRDNGKHWIIIPPNSQDLPILERNKQVTHSTFQLIHYQDFKEVISHQPNISKFKSIIIHFDGKHLALDINKYIELFKDAKVVFIEADFDTLNLIAPILKAYKFSKKKTYIYLSLWIKENVAR